MVNLRDELRMQMWSIRTRYDCTQKVLTHHKDLQRLPERQIRGALRHIWCDWTFTAMDTPREAHKAISSENARGMISTSEEIRQDRYDAVQAGHLSVYMEDVVRCLEKMERCETEEEESAYYYNR